MDTSSAERIRRPRHIATTAAPRDGWHGHLPITQLRMLSILERCTLGRSDFTLAERGLYTACEFWAAVKTHTLNAHLGSDAAERLRQASLVFTAMGAVHAGRSIDATRRGLATPLTPQQRRRRVSALEGQLRSVDEPIDQLIARFAQDAVRRPRGHSLTWGSSFSSSAAAV